jgi:Ca2+-transporting ATPase
VASTILINTDGNSYGKRIHKTGAAELVLVTCNKFLDSEGKVKEMDEESKNYFFSVIDQYRKEGMRNIAIAYKDLNRDEGGENHDEKGDVLNKVEEENFTLLSILGLRDNIWPELPSVVSSL